ncbi:unnamed protein product [Spirodela intermedia]|uniref:Protein arginine N-methyltransferase domain-containing protein n=2 Tax=Spirodela intermedia TaxID=51605 RepID=A0A7I8IEB6_SPIIN|nr:unnamed protein product [Spirodela intermedia]CAA6656140.1 unnamed protein product [Spirodela intermedia]CAA7391603.1 unnamed protein product [Spirodela intermedia]
MTISLLLGALTRSTSVASVLPNFPPQRAPFASFISTIPSLLGASRKMSAAAPQVAFQLRTNPLTGDSEWIVIEAADEHDENGIFGPGKSLLATTSYLDMLNDSRRNTAFHRAIQKTITRPCHVLDIGAGTGLLSMMAAKAMEECNGGQGSNEGMVSACESYLPMGKLMRRVLQANLMKTKITVHHKRSDELRIGMDLPCRADVMVSEVLDSELLGEGLIPTLQHAHDMLLVEHPKTVPYRATTYGQLVDSTFLQKLHDLHSSETSASDGVHLAPRGLENIVSVRPKQYAMHCDAISKEIILLSEPFKIFAFDFWRRPESHREINLCVKATDAGIVHAVISWWVLQLDDEGTIFYSTAPNWVNSSNISKEEKPITGNKVWCDHWKQCIWFAHGTGIPVSNNELITFQAAHDETSISYSFGKENQAAEFSKCDFRTVDRQLILCPERIGIYGDKDWRSSFLTALRNVLQNKSCPVCVIADDSIFLTISAACLSEESHIVSMLPGLRDLGSSYLKAISDFHGIPEDQIRVIGKKAACLTLDNLSGKKVDLLVAEPFYCGSEGMLPWQNMRFWKERSLLDSLLSDNALIMPSKGILKACAMSLPDLWNSRRSLKKVEGFDHLVANDALGACGDLGPGDESPCLPYFIWQCGETKELSVPSPVMEFNFFDSIHPSSGKIEIKFTRQGVCHGFALWIDWVLDEGNSIVISTGPGGRHWKQGVKLLSKPFPVTPPGPCANTDECHSAAIEASFDPSNGELNVRCSLSDA